MTVQIPYNFASLADIMQGEWISRNDGLPAAPYLCLDSRRVYMPEQSVFLAIHSSHRKATQFMPLLYSKGVRHFIVDIWEYSKEDLPGASILQVSDSIQALQRLTTWHRRGFPDLEVLAITGSNGKTMVKEWIHQLLAGTVSMVRSPKTYNSQIGVPLSVLQIRKEHELGIFEAGISAPGDMEPLENMILPCTGILTNIGAAHDEGFQNRQQKIREKILLFQHCQQVIIRGDEHDVKEEVMHLQEMHPSLRLFSWGYGSDADVRIKEVEKHLQGTFINEEDAIHSKRGYSRISCSFEGRDYDILLPFTDDGSVANAMHCLSFLLLTGRASVEVLERFRLLDPVAMRMEIKAGINRSTILNDSYSADLHSLSIALDFLQKQKYPVKKTIILSDILQSGISSEALYEQVAGLLRVHNVDRLIAIGRELSKYRNFFSFIPETSFFANTDAFLKNVQLHLFSDETILIKGARRFKFERISSLLERTVHQTALYINLSNLRHNLRTYRHMLQPSTRLMAMVKAFGYGAGSHEIASVLEFDKVDYLAVAYTDEGVELRRSGITTAIMVMNTDESTFDAIVSNHLEPELFSFPIVQAFIHYLRNNGLDNYPVHIKMDTGMHRLGFSEDEADALGVLLASSGYVHVKSVFSHLAASDDPGEDVFTRQQAASLLRSADILSNHLGYPFIRHIANTSAISRFPDLQFDMVRLGIGLHGIDAYAEMQAKLLPVAELKTTISQIKYIPAGDTIGYGRHGKAAADKVIGTVRIGYADGYPRSLSRGRGKMLVAGQLVPVIGNVCMDMLMLDLTDVPEVHEGAEVIVFGESPSLSKVAVWAHTIPYEIMTGISSRVKRIYFEE